MWETIKNALANVKEATGLEIPGLPDDLGSLGDTASNAARTVTDSVTESVSGLTGGALTEGGVTEGGVTEGGVTEGVGAVTEAVTGGVADVTETATAGLDSATQALPGVFDGLTGDGAT
jgi:hypothetical protein